MSAILEKVGAIGPKTTNGGKKTIEIELPFAVEFTLAGTCDMLFHRWNCEAVEAKSAAKKGSEAKKTDDIESYVYRDEEGNLCLPGNYVHQAMIKAGKYKQDPRSPRKSASDLLKAAIVPLNELASLGTKEWDYLHKCRAVVKMSAINRVRPAILKGWKATFQFQVLMPEYVNEDFLMDLLTLAGRSVGVADNRPTYGRFMVTNFQRLD